MLKMSQLTFSGLSCLFFQSREMPGIEGRAREREMGNDMHKGPQLDLNGGRDVSWSAP